MGRAMSQGGVSKASSVSPGEPHPQDQVIRRFPCGSGHSPEEGVLRPFRRLGTEGKQIKLGLEADGAGLADPTALGKVSQCLRTPFPLVEDAPLTTVGGLKDTCLSVFS